MNDLISRQAAIKLLDEQIRQCNKAILSPDISLKDEYAARVERASLNAYREHLSSLPSVEAPDINVGNMDDCISRKAAIDCLNNVSFDCSMDQEVVEEELLKLPPAHPTISKTENVEGAISRQQAVDFVGSMNMCDEISNEACKKLTSYLDELPSIQPERKTGRWIPDNTDYYRTKFICSVCGESEEVPTTGFGYGTMWDYCPYCGAKMERRRDGH